MNLFYFLQIIPGDITDNFTGGKISINILRHMTYAFVGNLPIRKHFTESSVYGLIL